MKKWFRYSTLGVLLLIIGLAGCARMFSVDARIEGRILLENLPVGELEGTKVVLDGDRIEYTEPNGTFAFQGVISGADEFELIVSHPGFQSMSITGTLAYELENDLNTTSIGDFTLPSY